MRIFEMLYFTGIVELYLNDYGYTEIGKVLTELERCVIFTTNYMNYV